MVWHRLGLERYIERINIMYIIYNIRDDKHIITKIIGRCRKYKERLECK